MTEHQLIEFQHILKEEEFKDIPLSMPAQDISISTEQSTSSEHTTFDTPHNLNKPQSNEAIIINFSKERKVDDTNSPRHFTSIQEQIKESKSNSSKLAIGERPDDVELDPLESMNYNSGDPTQEVNISDVMLDLTNSKNQIQSLERVHSFELSVLNGTYLPISHLIILLSWRELLIYRYSTKSLKNRLECKNAKIVRCLILGNIERLFVAGDDYYLAEIKIARKKIILLREQKEGYNIDDIRQIERNPDMVAVIIRNKGEIHIFKEKVPHWHLIHVFKHEILCNMKNEIIFIERDFIILTEIVLKAKKLIKVWRADKITYRYPFEICDKGDIKIIRNQQKIFLLFLVANASDANYHLVGLRIEDNGNRLLSIIPERWDLSTMKNLPIIGCAFLTDKSHRNWLLSVHRGEVRFHAMGQLDESWDRYSKNGTVGLEKDTFMGVSKDLITSIFRIKSSIEPLEDTALNQEENYNTNFDGSQLNSDFGCPDDLFQLNYQSEKEQE